MAIGALAVAACGDDGDAEVASLDDDPSVEECLEAAAAVLGRVEIPEDLDPADGLDDAEQDAVDAAIQDAAEGDFDPTDESHPCTQALQSATPEQVNQLFRDLDPEMIALLTAVAETEVEVETEPAP
jgi:hypothetical protein